MDETKPAPFLDPALAADDDDDDAALAAAVAASTAASAPAAADPNHGWQKVTYGKRQRRHQPPQAADPDRGGSASRGPDRSHVFASVEQRAHERRRALESAAAAAAAAANAAPSAAAAARAASSEEDDDDAAPQENGGEAPKKIKQKKPKKPKITVAEAAAGIDAENLAAHLIEISGSYETQQEIQLMRFADYFGRAFVGVSASQFPWAKMFKESPVSKIVDIPLSHISEPVYKTSVDWIGQKSPDALADFVLWCLDGVLADLASQQAAAKGSKKAAQQAPSRAQVAIFVVLAMTLRRKPDILISLLPKIRENSKYQGQEKLPLIVWVVAQASQGDLVVGMFAWAHYLFPNICGKSSGNPQSRDLVLQLVERLLSGPKARTILLNGAVRKGERLMPPAALDLLMRVTFPPSAARVKATERFEAVYPTLKELALAGSPATKTTKQASQQILPSCIKAMQENNPELTKEAADIFIWCLTQNSDCYKQWEKLHLENVEASIVVLREIFTEWKELSAKLSPDALRETVKNLKAKNEEALSATEDASKQGPIKEADKYCKLILGRLKSGFSCVKGSLIVLAVAAVVSFAMSPTIESLDWGKLHTVFSAAKSF
ncbi:Transmembrane protein 214-B [Ananas comosus]|uniref:Transmembrane protein 214-B n=1 Tax=Ananas comosus TaxID=4615 RepID=A0A199UME1_ANACO|nr:Transmembrane protein 214-B [Ananas comosus]